MSSTPTTSSSTPLFGRVLTAMATPFGPTGALDLDGAQRLAAYLADHGSEGLVVCGTTGESPTLTHDETLTMFRAVVDAVGERVAVVAGTGKNDTAATVSLTREAEACGVDGMLVVTPYYNKPSQRGLRHHFTEVARTTTLPVLIYNIPGRTGREVEVDTLVDLATEVPNIVGVKDAVGDLTKTAALAARAPEGFTIFAGDDAATLPMLAVGGAGVISVASHLVGEEFVEMVEVFPKDPARARAIHHRLLPLMTTLMTADPSPGPLKAALGILGLPGGGVRAPLVDADAEVVAKVRDAMAAAEVVAR